MKKQGQQGFSLLEVLIAMVITVMVSGTMYLFMYDSENTFRREPERVERQQNIRMAMDIIQRDLADAGAGMGPFVQVFTNGLDNYAPAAYPAVPSVIVPGENVDALEMLVSSGDCPDVQLEPNGPPPLTPVTGANINTPLDIPNCYITPGFIMIYYDNGTAYKGWGNRTIAGNTKIVFPMGNVQPPQSDFGAGHRFQLPDDPSIGGIAFRIGSVRYVRYEIAPDPLDENVPCLWRSATGGIDPATVAQGDPPSPGWDLIARGIEDMQVEYINGVGWTNGAGPDDSNNWLDTPGLICGGNPCSNVNAADYNTIIRQVRVTLSARVARAANLQGEVVDSLGRRTISGRLSVAITPKEVPIVLSRTTPNPPLPMWR